MHISLLKIHFWRKKTLLENTLLENTFIKVVDTGDGNDNENNNDVADDCDFDH